MLEPTTCRCGYRLEMGTPVRGDGTKTEPAQGDYTFCLNCAELHIVDDNKLRPLTDDELIDMPLDVKKELSAIQIRIREFNQKRRE